MKYICKTCLKPCELTVEGVLESFIPLSCPLGSANNQSASWKVIEDDDKTDHKRDRFGHLIFNN